MIKKYIYENKLQPGALLPSQAAMCEMMGASRPSVREAVKTMEAQGMVRVLNGKGIYVEQVDTSFHVGPMNTAYNVKLIKDALEVRKVLESLAVERCIQNASDQQLQDLSGILSEVEARYYRREEQSHLDLLFHKTLINLAGNSLLSNMMKNLMQHSSGLWSMKGKIAEILSDSIPSHRVVMDFIIDRNIQAAVRENNRYMDRMLEALDSIVEEAEL